MFRRTISIRPMPFHTTSMVIILVKLVKILNFKFFKKKKKGGKTVIYRNSPKKSFDFSRSQTTKWIAPLELSCKI